MQNLQEMVRSVLAIFSRKRHAALGQPGELPIKVFISSVMEKTGGERLEIVKTLKGLEWAGSWAFEYTPGSSEKVTEGYLRHVAEADFVIWIVTPHISEPVVNEVDTALCTDKRLIIVLLSSVDSLSDACRRQLDRVSSVAKWVQPQLYGSLKRAITDTFGDEIKRALRTRRSSIRVPLLEAEMMQSRARCLARWTIAGVHQEVALRFLDDPEIPNLDFLSSYEREKLLLLEGPAGIGKSLVAERIFQTAVKKALTSGHAPIPVHIEARNFEGSLSDAIKEKTDGIGLFGERGGLVVIDGLDECDARLAHLLLAEARLLVDNNKHVRVIITSRPFQYECKRVQIPPLGEAQALDLIGAISGRRPYDHERFRWPKTVQEAIRYPLFAIAFGGYLREHKAAPLKPTSKADLLKTIVMRALQAVGGQRNDKVREALGKLSVLSLDRGPSVCLQEVAAYDIFPYLLATGLVTISDNHIGFSLALLAEWFAAEELVKGRVDLVSLVSDPIRLHNWRSVLVLALGAYPISQVESILETIGKCDAGLMGQIIDQGLTEYASDASVLPPALEAGRKIRHAMSVLCDDIGSLAKVIGPVTGEGQICPIGVRTDGPRLTTSWYRGAGPVEDVVVLPEDIWKVPHRGFSVISSCAPGGEEAWAWRWSLEYLQDRLAEAIKGRWFPTEDPYLTWESAWGYAERLLNKGLMVPPGVDEVEKALDRLRDPRQVRLLHPNPYGYLSLRRVIKLAKASNQALLVPPWPMPDQWPPPGNCVWDLYSDERIRTRAIAVYEGAISGYVDIVNRWFSRLSPRMNKAVTLPARLVGVLNLPQRGKGALYGPSAEWRWQALPAGSASEVQLTISNDPFSWEDYEKTAKELAEARPKAPWATATLTTEALDIFYTDSATRIAYRWLKDDLKALSWIK